LEVGIHDVFEGTTPESAIGDYENTKNLSEFFAKQVRIRLSTSGTGICNVTAGPHDGISPFYFVHLLPRISDSNLYNRYINVKL